ncbi:hypothetical protein METBISCDRAFT_22403 [Metschnikowia bicuspidata]|uniref:SRP9 domain-containing protein n=1 Tax=Metschnikowia bicuspidata TaxID=27322 RepID=A0A4P9ZGJ4_9ASCO|nr:hypothetical protein METBISCDRAFT_22403 [Metschnikowia bicuspidata]
MDTFISSALRVLEAYPTATVSVTYSKVDKKEGIELARKARNKVKFKVYDSGLSACVRYSTTSSKNLAELLSFLSPGGTAGCRKRKTDLEEVPEESSEKRSKPSIGAAGLMSNHVPEPLPNFSYEEAAENAKKGDLLGSGKKKKKGKKK